MKRILGLRGMYWSGVAAGALVVSSAWAQDRAAGELVDNEAPAEIVVWGTKVRSDSLYLGDSDIALRQADHLSDLLRYIPGVDVGGTHSVNTRINFRGLDDRDLNVFIDGALQTNYIYHHIGNLLINPDILQSADIQLGANSITYGGLGGAIRFETKDARDLLDRGQTIGGRISGTYNSNALWGGSAALYGTVGEQLDLLAYYNVADRGNFEDGSGRDTIGSDGLTQNVLLKGRFHIDDRQSIRLSYDRYWDEGDYTQRPDMGVLTNEAITGDILIPTEYTRETVNLGYRLVLGAPLTLDATLYTNDLKLYRDESNPAIPRGIRTDRQVTADNWGANILARSRISTGAVEHVFTYGVDLLDQQFSYVPDVTGGGAPVEQDARLLAVFVEDSIEFGDRFVLRPGIRWNDYELQFRATGEEGSWDEVSLALAGEAELTDGFRLLASYTELFRGPELAEPFGGNAGRKIVNPALEPETGRNIEAGFRYGRNFGRTAVRLGANYFDTRIENYIGEVPVAGGQAGTVQDANLGTARLDGFEASASADFGNVEALVTFASSVLDPSGLTNADLSESLREIGDTLGGELLYVVPEHGLTFGWNGLVVFDKSTALDEVKQGYTIHNVSARWESAFRVDGLTLIAGVDNLFDETYTSHASRTGITVHPVFGPLVLNDVEPGRNVKFTAAFRF